MDGSLIGNRERSEEAGGSGRSESLYLPGEFRSNGSAACGPGITRLGCNLRWEPTQVNVQDRFLYFFIFFYNHLEIGDKTKLQQVDLEMNRCLAERMILSFFGEQILHFTCDINRCLFELLHHPIR